MTYTLCGTSAVMLAGFGVEWRYFPWLGLLVCGLLMGTYSAAKMSSVPIAAAHTGRSTTAVNAAMSVVFLLGLLFGLPTGTWTAGAVQHHGYLALAGLCGVAALVSAFARFPNETLRSFRAEQQTLVRETVRLYAEHPVYLVSGPLLWGVAGATNMALTAYVIGHGIASPQKAAFIPLYAAIGVIAGNLASPLFHRRRSVTAFGATLGMLATVLAIPHVAARAVVIICVVIVVGVMFGLATNLVDAAFLELAAAEGKEGVGAALQSATIAMCSVIVSGSIGTALLFHWVTPESQFLVLGALISVSAALLLWLTVSRAFK